MRKEKWLESHWIPDEAFSNLGGKRLEEIGVTRNYDLPVVLVKADGRWYAQHHNQDCCESVELCDEPALSPKTRNSIILLAEERVDSGRTGDLSHMTWTFYEVGTAEESFTIRWVGESNGYYSEGVDFRQAPEGWEPPADCGFFSWFLEEE